MIKYFLILMPFVLPLKLPASTFCEGYKLFPRVSGDKHEISLKNVGADWVQKNSIVLKGKADLEKLNWSTPGKVPFRDDMFFQSTYKFAINKNCDMVLSTQAWRDGLLIPQKDINHVVLAGSDEAFSTGNIILLKNDTTGKPEFLLTNRDTKFCTSAQSLDIAEMHLQKHGWVKNKDFTSLVAFTGECKALTKKR